MSVLLKYSKRYADANAWSLRDTPQQDTNTARVDVYRSCVRDGLIVDNVSTEDFENLTIHRTIIYKDMAAREEHIERLDAALAAAGITEEEVDVEGVVTGEYILVVDGVETIL